MIILSRLHDLLAFSGSDFCRMQVSVIYGSDCSDKQIPSLVLLKKHVIVNDNSSKTAPITEITGPQGPDGTVIKSVHLLIRG